MREQPGRPVINRTSQLLYTPLAGGPTTKWPVLPTASYNRTSILRVCQVTVELSRGETWPQQDVSGILAGKYEQEHLKNRIFATNHLQYKSLHNLRYKHCKKESQLQFGIIRCYSTHPWARDGICTGETGVWSRLICQKPDSMVTPLISNFVCLEEKTGLLDIRYNLSLGVILKEALRLEGYLPGFKAIHPCPREIHWSFGILQGDVWEVALLSLSGDAEHFTKPFAILAKRHHNCSTWFNPTYIAFLNYNQLGYQSLNYLKPKTTLPNGGTTFSVQKFNKAPDFIPILQRLWFWVVAILGLISSYRKDGADHE